MGLEAVFLAADVLLAYHQVAIAIPGAFIAVGAFFMVVAFFYKQECSGSNYQKQ